MTTFYVLNPPTSKEMGKIYDPYLEATRSEFISSLYLQFIVSHNPNMRGILTEIFTDELN